MRNITPCLFAGGLLAALLLNGCATVTRGRTELLTVLSEPAGASIRLSNGNTGVTPASFTVPRKGDVYVTVFMDGFETAGVIVPAKLSTTGTVGFLGNALIGGIIGGGVDVYTGATLSHEPNPVMFKLVPKPPKVAPGTTSPPPPATSTAAASEPAKPAVPPPVAPPATAVAVAPAAPTTSAAPVQAAAPPAEAPPPAAAAPPVEAAKAPDTPAAAAPATPVAPPVVTGAPAQLSPSDGTNGSSPPPAETPRK
jgi:hypothetical protein